MRFAEARQQQTRLRLRWIGRATTYLETLNHSYKFNRSGYFNWASLDFYTFSLVAFTWRKPNVVGPFDDFLVVGLSLL